jgi:hypothetical protein
MSVEDQLSGLMKVKHNSMRYPLSLLFLNVLAMVTIMPRYNPPSCLRKAHFKGNFITSAVSLPTKDEAEICMPQELVICRENHMPGFLLFPRIKSLPVTGGRGP